MRVLILQYSGDYRAAVRSLAKGGSDTYYAQKYSVDAVAALVPQVEAVTVLCCTMSEPYNEVLENGVCAIGGGFSGQIPADALIALIAAQNPTHLIVQFPMRPVFKWAIKHKVKTIAVLAESIVTKSLRAKLRGYRLVGLLNHKQIEWVGSYGVTASLALQSLGVKADKIIPWDFLITTEPSSLPPKLLRQDLDSWNLIYVGSMILEKGVSDILEAVAMMRSLNQPVTLTVIGNDTTGFFAEQAKQLAIADHVKFYGIVATSMIEPLMREADVVLVPSHHEYPEGFPLVIHHALCARTPLIASDHPMFRLHLQHGVNALIVPAKNPGALAASVERLMTDPSLYLKLSQAAHSTWHRLRLPVKWADVIYNWLFDSERNRQWFMQHCLSSERYSSTKELLL